VYQDRSLEESRGADEGERRGGGRAMMEINILFFNMLTRNPFLKNLGGVRLVGGDFWIARWFFAAIACILAGSGNFPDTQRQISRARSIMQDVRAGFQKDSVSRCAAVRYHRCQIDLCVSAACMGSVCTDPAATRLYR